MVRVTADGSVMPWLFVAEPETATLLSGSSLSLFTAEIVTAPLLVVDPAAIVSVLSVLNV